jgi:hypothetical protein
MEKCYENYNNGRRNDARVHVIEAEESSVVGDNIVDIYGEQGENLIFKRISLKPKKKIVEEPN